jgi:Cu(I)/Ag(I) efflux system protein CusF
MEMKGMKDMDMKGMDMKDMDAQKCSDMMKSMDKKAANTKATKHQADGMVKGVDADGKVTLAHGPVKNLGWPAMSMAFAVKDKTLLEKLTVGSKVHVEFDKQDSDYVITELMLRTAVRRSPQLLKFGVGSARSIDK